MKQVNYELESSIKFLLQSPSQPNNLFPASFPVLKGAIKFWKSTKVFLFWRASGKPGFSATPPSSLDSVRPFTKLLACIDNTKATDNTQCKLKQVGIIAPVGKISITVDVSAPPTFVIPFSYVVKWHLCSFLPYILASDAIFQEKLSIDIFDYLFRFFFFLTK